MGDIVQFKPRGKEGEPISATSEKRMIIPSLDALYDEDQIMVGGRSISAWRSLLSESSQAQAALEMLEDRLLASRMLYIQETIKPEGQRRKALLDLAKYTYSSALDMENAELRLIATKMIEKFGSIRRAGAIIENIKIKRGIKPKS